MRIILVIFIINEKETVRHRKAMMFVKLSYLILDKNGKKIYSSLLDFYSKETERKAKQHYGSDNFFINIEKIWTL